MFGKYVGMKYVAQIIFSPVFFPWGRGWMEGVNLCLGFCAQTNSSIRCCDVRRIFGLSMTNPTWHRSKALGSCTNPSCIIALSLTQTKDLTYCIIESLSLVGCLHKPFLYDISLSLKITPIMQKMDLFHIRLLFNNIIVFVLSSPNQPLSQIFCFVIENYTRSTTPRLSCLAPACFVKFASSLMTTKATHAYIPHISALPYLHRQIYISIIDDYIIDAAKGPCLLYICFCFIIHFSLSRNMHMEVILLHVEIWSNKT